MEVSVIEQDYGCQPRMCRCYPTCHRIAGGVTQAHQLSPVFPVDGHNLSSDVVPLSASVTVTILDHAAGGAATLSFPNSSWGHGSPILRMPLLPWRTQPSPKRNRPAQSGGLFAERTRAADGDVLSVR